MKGVEFSCDVSLHVGPEDLDSAGELGFGVIGFGVTSR